MNDPTPPVPLTPSEQSIAIAERAVAELHALIPQDGNGCDIELAHLKADDILLKTLIDLGLADVAAAFNNMRNEVDFYYS